MEYLRDKVLGHFRQARSERSGQLVELWPKRHFNEPPVYSRHHRRPTLPLDRFVNLELA